LLILRAITSFIFIVTGVAIGVTQPDEEGGKAPQSVSLVREDITKPTAVPEEPAEKDNARKVPLPKDEFWDELARCETASNWQDTGRWSGGLGIYNTGTFPQSSMGTWERWGGEEFALTPQEATRRQQIIVANRIAVLGWTTVVQRDPEYAARHGIPVEYIYVKKPVGFGGWGALPCAGGRPPLFYHKDTSKILTMDFSVTQPYTYVYDLQGLIGVKQDGIYGSSTRNAHQRYLEAWGLPLDTLG
jgi:hypothetical protein